MSEASGVGSMETIAVGGAADGHEAWVVGGNEALDHFGDGDFDQSRTRSQSGQAR